jgi:hypothetical protein
MKKQTKVVTCMDKGDHSTPLTLTFSEQQWLTVGVAISKRLEAPDCHLVEKENLFPVALHLQQTINRLWRDSWPPESWNQDLPIVNFAGREGGETDAEYLFGNSCN